MRHFFIAAMLFSAGVTLCHSADVEGEREVHAVGIYEGYDPTGGRNRSHADVHVNRPGKRVTLVLVAYSETVWQVSLAKQTQLNEVILGGYETQSVVGLPAKTKVTKAFGENSKRLRSAYKMGGPRFRFLVKQVYGFTREQLSSFQGQYRAPADAAFVVNQIQRDERLSTEYPRKTPLDELPSEVQDLKFDAHHYASRRGFGEDVSFGQFTLEGPVASSLKPLPKRVKRICYDPVGECYYGISGHEVVRIDAELKTVTELKIPGNLPELSWPCEITYDTKRNRVIVGSSGGGGYLYAYSTKNQQWSVISKRPGSLDAFAYSPEDDMLYGVLFEHADDGNVASLAQVNAHGALVKRISLGPPILNGSLANGPGVCTTRVVKAGKHIVILASPSDGGDRTYADAAMIYLVDPATKKVWLTSKRSVD